jgi:hypothetical protein
MELDVVKGAVEALTAEQQPITAATVRARIGFGSKRHILQCMHELGVVGRTTRPRNPTPADPPPDGPDPQAVYDGLLEAIADTQAQLAALEAAEQLSTEDAVRQLQLQRQVRTLQQRLPAAEQAALKHSAERAMNAAQTQWDALRAQKLQCWDDLDQALTRLEEALSRLRQVHVQQQTLVPDLDALLPVAGWLVDQRLWRFLGRDLRRLEEINLQHPKLHDPGLSGRIRSAHRNGNGVVASFQPRKD